MQGASKRWARRKEPSSALVSSSESSDTWNFGVGKWNILNFEIEDIARFKSFKAIFLVLRLFLLLALNRCHEFDLQVLRLRRLAIYKTQVGRWRI